MLLRRSPLALLGALLAFALAPSSASAITECGKSGFARNITTSGVSCSTARSFTRAYGVSPACQEDTRCQLRGYSCRNRLISRSGSRGTIDARCTRGSKVIRFQWTIGL